MPYWLLALSNTITVSTLSIWLYGWKGLIGFLIAGWLINLVALRSINRKVFF